MTNSVTIWRKLNLSWGVTPILSAKYENMTEMFDNAIRKAKDAMGLQPGDNVVLTGGTMNGTSGNTNLIKVERV